MPLGYQAVDHVAANETGPAGNQNSHILCLFVRTEGQRDGGTERHENLQFSLSLRPSVPPSSSSNPPVFKSSSLDGRLVENIASVDEHSRVHHLADLIEVEVAKLIPLGDNDDSVTIF